MKRWIGLIAVLLVFLTGSAWAEGLLCVSVDNQAALLSDDGAEIVSPGMYDDVFCVIEGERYALGTLSEGGMRYALCDASGNLLTESHYEMFLASEDVVLFRQDRLYGAMDVGGNVLVPPKYTQLARAGIDGYLAMETDPFDNEADEILFLSDSGEALATGIYSEKGLESFADGLMLFQAPDTELYGYLNADGAVAIEAKFVAAERFENGIARASQHGMLGVVGVDGEWRIEPEYDYLEIGDDVIVGLAGRERCVVYDGECEERFRIEGVKLETALVGQFIIVMEGDDTRVYSPEGRVVLETDRHSTLLPGLDGQIIYSDGQWGEACVSLVNADGTQSERRDQHLIPLNSGRYAFVKMNAAAYYSEALDEVRYSCDYDSMRFGMMDGSGREILPAEYLEIRALGSTRYLLVSAQMLQVADAEGNVLWERARE